MTLNGVEFLRRFLLHVLPTGFVRIRYYGLFANRCRAKNLERCRALLAADPDAPASPAPTPPQPPKLAGDEERFRCPCCGIGVLRHVGVISPAPLSEMEGWAPLPRDTS
jgi:hypothetical protein